MEWDGCERTLKTQGFYNTLIVDSWNALNNHMTHVIENLNLSLPLDISLKFNCTTH